MTLWNIILFKNAKIDSTGTQVIVQGTVVIVRITAYVTKKRDTVLLDVTLIFWVRCVKVCLNTLYDCEVHAEICLSFIVWAITLTLFLFIKFIAKNCKMFHPETYTIL